MLQRPDDRRGPDEDMTTLDMTKNIAYMHICQVYGTFVQSTYEDKEERDIYLLSKKFSHVTFHVNGSEHTVHFPRKQPQVHSINSIGKIPSIIIGGFEFPLPTVKKKYDILLGMCISPLR